MANKVISAIKRAVLLLGLISAPICGVSEDYASQLIGPFGTLNNTDPAVTLQGSQSQDLLNVDITAGGMSVKKRDGYGLAYTLAIATSAVHGTYTFYNSGGSEVSLFFNDTRLSASVGGSQPSVLFSTGASGYTYQCVDSNNQAYCVNRNKSILIKTDGSTYSQIATASQGDVISVTPTRLVIAGASANRIDFSKAGDFTTWTVGGNPTDPYQVTIYSPGSGIKHITYAFERTMWFKDKSFGYILEGPTHGDWEVVTISNELGTNDNTSVYREGILYFRGNDSHIYAYDGSNLTKLSKDIQGIIALSQYQVANSWELTSATDFITGSSITETNALSTVSYSGSIVLSTQAYTYVYESNKVHFDSGTFSDTTSTQSVGYVDLAIGYATSTVNNYGVSDLDDHEELLPASPSVDASLTTVLGGSGSGAGCLLVGAGAYLNKVGSPGDDISIYVYCSTGGARVGGGVIPIEDVPTGDWASSTFTTPVPLNAGVSYYIRIGCSPSGCSGNDSSNYVEVYGNNFIGIDPVTLYSGQISTKTYAASGTYISNALDVSYSTSDWQWAWGEMIANASIPTNTTLTYETQTSTSPTGEWSALQVATSGVNIPSPVNRYIRYKATLATDDKSISPKLNNITLNTSSMTRTSGTYKSTVKSSLGLTSWSTFNADQTLNDGTITYYVRGSTTIFVTTDTTPSWTAVSNGAIPTASTGTYIQMRADFAVTNSTQSPKLDSLVVEWNEGNASDKSYATYFDDAIWWSMSYGNGVSTNTHIVKYDMVNKGWLLYDIGSNGFIVRNQHLYFGDPAAGKIYIFGDVDSDNGDDINSYWESKDFTFGAPFQDKDFYNLSFIAGSVYGSTMTVTWTVDGSSSSTSQVYLYDSGSNYLNKNFKFPLGTVGKTISIKFGNNDTDMPWEVYGAQVGYRPKAWRVEP